MKILAVIPARAGSKGIPNKNIRLVNNKPLIYYSIKNALESKWITDVIVTTDSPEIEIIAKQMGVIYKQRDEKLCGDAVTLDSVIYDAIPENSEYDYIVTMQPTSPTLKATTLMMRLHIQLNMIWIQLYLLLINHIYPGAKKKVKKFQIIRRD